MSKRIQIPDCMFPSFEVIVNGVTYRYPAGETVEVPDDVATVIEAHIIGMHSKPPAGGGGAAPVVNVADLPVDESAAGEPFFLVEREGQVSRLSMQVFIEYLKEQGLGGDEDVPSYGYNGPTFTVNPLGHFKFEEGMTWESWINSPYNTRGFIFNNAYGNYITDSVALYGFAVSSYEAEIVADSTYEYVDTQTSDPYSVLSVSTFTIDGYGAFNYDSGGYSWTDWCNSLLNTFGFTISDANTENAWLDFGDGYGVYVNDTEPVTSVTNYTPVKKPGDTPSGTTFTVAYFDVYEFEEGMSWADWLSSGYNTDRFGVHELYGTYIDVDGMHGFPVNSFEDLIIAGETHTPVVMQTGKPYGEIVGDATFTIEGYGAFTFENGMTWADWVESEYNTNRYNYSELYGCYLDLGDGYGVEIDMSSEIVPDAVYTTKLMAQE